MVLSLLIVTHILALAVLSGTGLTLAALIAPHTWSERDWNNDGTITLGEFYYATDVGRRPVVINGLRCDELIDYKDGRPLKTVCPGTAGASG